MYIQNDVYLLRFNFLESLFTLVLFIDPFLGDTSFFLSSFSEISTLTSLPSKTEERNINETEFDFEIHGKST